MIFNKKYNNAQHSKSLKGDTEEKFAIAFCSFLLILFKTSFEILFVHCITAGMKRNFIFTVLKVHYCMKEYIMI